MQFMRFRLRELRRSLITNQYDLVGAMLFLCSSDSDFMIGQTVVVDGGHVMI